jgi:hypothetical protein
VAVPGTGGQSLSNQGTSGSNGYATISW